VGSKIPGGGGVYLGLTLPLKKYDKKYKDFRFINKNLFLLMLYEISEIEK
jgi:hypothetical protein